MNIIKEVFRRITPYMRANGFVPSGKSFCRLANDIAYCISFDAPGGLLYVTAHLMPLYVPCESKYYTYGNRLNAIQKISLPLLNKNDAEAIINTWCLTLCEQIDRHILPFFEDVGSPQKLLAYVDSHSCALNEYIACHDVYIWRLKFYTHLYMGDYDKASSAISCCREVLSNITFLSDLVIQKYRAEIDEIELILQEERAIVEKYCISVICNTKKVMN